MGEFKSPETREAEAMIAKAVSIMKADGRIEESELGILRGITSRLGIDEATAERILEDPEDVESSLPGDPFKRALFIVFMASAVWADGHAYPPWRSGSDRTPYGCPSVLPCGLPRRALNC